MNTRIKTDEEIVNIRESGKMLATVLDVMRSRTQAGISPKDLAIVAAKELKALGGEPAFLGYQGFPDVICISVNEEVVHGIPGAEELVEGDLISYDFGVKYKGMITDSAITVPVGTISDDAKRLVEATKEAMYAGIKTLKHGVRVGDIGEAVERVLNRNNLGIVRDLVGHGVGHQIHEEPNIPNYGTKGTGPELQAGMTIAIEPMATLGGDDVAMLKDGWTVITRDASLSAHFEHTVLITKTGSEIITKV